jgi:Helix-turn-helix domain
MSMTAVALSSFLPMWQHRLEAVLALLRGEPGQQVAERFRMTRSDLYKFRARALQALRYALLDQPRGPKRPHNRLAADREEAVMQSLHQHPTWSARQLHEYSGDEVSVWSKNSCGLAMIVGEQPTEPLSALDRRVQLRLRFC